MNIKHIVWDWNGTLLNDAIASAKAIDDVLNKRNLGRVPLELYRRKIVFPVIDVYIESGLDFEKESFQDICDEYLNNYLNEAANISLHDDAEFVIKEFQKRGLIQHIVSASDIGVLKNQINYYGLEKNFDKVLGQDNNRADSKVNLAKQLLTLVDCKPVDMLFIGDTIHDYEVANEVGMNSALVSNGHCSEERLKKTGAPVYDNLTALLNSLSQDRRLSYTEK